jgi:hypothetical protein
MLWSMPSHLACVVCVYMQNQGIWEHADVVIMIKLVSWHNTGFCLCILFAYSACSKVFRAFELYNTDKCDMYVRPIRIWGFFWSDFRPWKQVYLLHCLLLFMHQKGYSMVNLDEARAYVHIHTRLCCVCMASITCWMPCAGHDLCKQNTCMLLTIRECQAYAFTMCKCGLEWVHICVSSICIQYVKVQPWMGTYLCLKHMHSFCASAALNGYIFVFQAYAFCMCKCSLESVHICVSSIRIQHTHSSIRINSVAHLLSSESYQLSSASLEPWVLSTQQRISWAVSLMN